MNGRLRQTKGLKEGPFGSYNGFELSTVDYIASKLPQITRFAIYSSIPGKFIQHLYASKNISEQINLKINFE